MWLRLDRECHAEQTNRIPQNEICDLFDLFTADQFKNWTLVFSSIALKGILPEEHLQLWKAFVKACSIMCRRNISKSACRTADCLLVQFCKSVESLYGKDNVTMNMHLRQLNGNLSECIFDYGPVYTFWCFAFERFNGILGSYHVNNHQIEVQLMRRFLENQDIEGIVWPDNCSSFREILRAPSCNLRFLGKFCKSQWL